MGCDRCERLERELLRDQLRQQAEIYARERIRYEAQIQALIDSSALWQRYLDSLKPGM